MKLVTRALLAGLAVGSGSAALAHAGHGIDSLFAGLVHPLATAAALLHGLAHAVHLPAGAPLAAYAAVLLALAMLLQVMVMRLGPAMTRAHRWTWRAAVAALGVSGVWLLSLA